MRFTKTPSDTYFLSGSGYQLSCQVECANCFSTNTYMFNGVQSHPCDVMYQWSQDGNLLNSSSSNHRILSNGTLVVILPHSIKEKRVHRCIATNEHGSIASHPITVKLAGESLIRCRHHPVYKGFIFFFFTVATNPY
jgi:hypothetical protein